MPLRSSHRTAHLVALSSRRLQTGLSTKAGTPTLPAMGPQLAKGLAAQLLPCSSVPPATGREQGENAFAKKLEGKIGRRNKHSGPEEYIY